MRNGNRVSRRWDSMYSLNLDHLDIDSESRTVVAVRNKTYYTKPVGQCGTITAYSNALCRCQKCRDVWAAYTKESRARRSRLTEGVPHGTYTGYNNWGCKCEECSEVGRAYKRASYKRARASGT